MRKGLLSAADIELRDSSATFSSLGRHSQIIQLVYAIRQLSYLANTVWTCLGSKEYSKGCIEPAVPLPRNLPLILRGSLVEPEAVASYIVHIFFWLRFSPCSVVAQGGISFVLCPAAPAGLLLHFRGQRASDVLLSSSFA